MGYFGRQRNGSVEIFKMNFDQKYQELLNSVLSNGSLEENRTGISAYTIPSYHFQLDAIRYSPLLTLRKTPVKSTLVELEGFINAVTSKKWYQERHCNFWSAWANPQKVKYGNDEESKRKMLEEDDLGVIYGANWRCFGVPSKQAGETVIFHGKDQLLEIVNTLKTNPQDRRMLCLAWNPLALEHAALPACHCLFRVMVVGGRLHLSWYQRSCDAILGFPANFLSYSTLLLLLSLESKIPVGTVTAHLDLVHIYENHLKGAKELINRTPNNKIEPSICINDFKSIFDWKHSDTSILNYNPQEAIKFDVAI